MTTFSGAITTNSILTVGTGLLTVNPTTGNLLTSGTVNAASLIIGSTIKTTLASNATSNQTIYMPLLGTSSDVVVTLGAAQTLTNKTLTSPTISSILNSGTLVLPTSSDTLMGRATVDVLSNKSIVTGSCYVVDSTDNTKKYSWSLSGATTATMTMFSFAQTANRTLTFPDATDTMVGRATTDTLSNKSLVAASSYIVDGTDTTKKHSWALSGATTATTMTFVLSQTASRSLTFPDITDTLVARTTTDTLTNKTLTSTTNNIAANILNSATTAINVSSATAPTAGQVLTATSSTAATWQTPSGTQNLTGNYTVSPGTTTLNTFVTTGPINFNGSQTLGSAGSLRYGTTSISAKTDINNGTAWRTLVSGTLLQPGSQVGSAYHPSGGGSTSNAGTSVAAPLNNSAYIAVGMPYDSSNIGAVAICTLSSGAYSQYQKITTSNYTTAPSFGSLVAFTASGIWLSVAGPTAASGQSYIYHFYYNGTTFTQSAFGTTNGSVLASVGLANCNDGTYFICGCCSTSGYYEIDYTIGTAGALTYANTSSPGSPGVLAITYSPDASTRALIFNLSSNNLFICKRTTENNFDAAATQTYSSIAYPINSLALNTNGTTMVAGSPSNAAVYVYSISSGGVPTLLSTLTVASVTYFGSSVTMNGAATFLSVSALNKGSANPGAVYTFTGSSGTFTLQSTLAPSGLTTTNCDFGYSISYGSSVLAIGAPLDATGGGTVVVYSLNETSTPSLNVPDTCNYNNFSVGTGTALATINTGTLAGNRTYSIQDMGANANFVFDQGNQTINGTKTFSSNVNIGANCQASSFSIPNPTPYILLQNVAGSAGFFQAWTLPTTNVFYTLTVPNPGTNANFIMSQGAQTIAGATTYSSAVAITPTTNQLVLGGTYTTTLSAAAPTASRTYTFPDAGANASVHLSQGNQSFGTSIAGLSLASIGGGANSTGGSASNQIEFQYGPSPGGFRHFIRSQHDGSPTPLTNKLQFYINTNNTFSTSTTPGTGNALSFEITQTGANLPLTSNQIAFGTSSSYYTTISVPPPSTNNRIYTVPDAGFATANFVLDVAAQTISNKSINCGASYIVDGTDTTKKQTWLLSGATTGTTTTLSFAQTANRTITFQDATDTVVGRATTDNLSNKSLVAGSSYIVDGTDTTKKHNYTVSGATTATTMTFALAQTASRTLTFPDATDTLVARATTDTLTNKTLTSTTNNVAANSLNTTTTAVNVSSAVAPTTGQMLLATSATTATWQTSLYTSNVIYSNTATTKFLISRAYFTVSGTGPTVTFSFSDNLNTTTTISTNSMTIAFLTNYTTKVLAFATAGTTTGTNYQINAYPSSTNVILHLFTAGGSSASWTSLSAGALYVNLMIFGDI